MSRIRTMLAALTSAVLLALLAVGLAAPAAAQHKHGVCGFHWKKNLENRERVLQCWASKRGLGRWRTLRVARCESGRDLLDNYIADGLGGTFQHVVPYWPGRAKAYGAKGYGVRNVWAQARVSTGMARDFGWSAHWPNCAAA